MAKVVFITSRFPYPTDKGDKLRVYHQLKSLSADHEIHLITINSRTVSKEQEAALATYCGSIHCYVVPFYKRILQLIKSLLSNLPLQVAYFYCPKTKSSIEKLIQEIKPEHIHCHLIRTTEFVKGIPNVKKSLDFMDAFGQGMTRRQHSETNILKKLLFRYEAKKLYRYESEIFSYIDRFCIISEQDRRAIKNDKANEIVVIPNGVDFEVFYPRNENIKYDLVFMGNLDYPPNVDAVKFIGNSILPELKKKLPDIKILIAGVNATKSIKALKSENLEVIENFQNISDAIAFAKIMLAPMRLSIGLQNKIIQAMAMKKPCVVSSLANNAIGAKNNTEIIEANTAEEFSNEILALLESESKMKTIGVNGYNFVTKNYSWIDQNQLLSEIFTTA